MHRRASNPARLAENPLANSAVIPTKAILTSTIGICAASSIRDGGESMQRT